jgi:hypothetical protein
MIASQMEAGREKQGQNDTRGKYFLLIEDAAGEAYR